MLHLLKINFWTHGNFLLLPWVYTYYYTPLDIFILFPFLILPYPEAIAKEVQQLKVYLLFNQNLRTSTDKSYAGQVSQ